jgi:hypothetical protein
VHAPLSGEPKRGEPVPSRGLGKGDALDHPHPDEELVRAALVSVGLGDHSLPVNVEYPPMTGVPGGHVVAGAGVAGESNLAVGARRGVEIGGNVQPEVHPSESPNSTGLIALAL